MRVKNRKTIRNLADKSFRAAGLRNGIAIGAIALTAILFTSLFTITIGMIESFQYMTARQSGGDDHGVFKYLSQTEYEKIRTHPLIQTITYNRIIADSVDNEEFLKRHVEMYQMDAQARKDGFISLPEENAPVRENDIAMDTNSLDLLGISHEIGQKITLKMTVNGEKVERQFRLCGWWESDPLLDVGFGLVSQAYCDKYEKELTKENPEDPVNCDIATTGSINAYVKFSNTFGIQKKLDRIIEESGYSTDPDSDFYISSNANWSYLSTSLDKDPKVIVGIFGVLFLIMLTGYLIIYNIFQISVIRDIRFYGLLKTIGTTKKQIKAMIRRQALLLSAAGIPLGMFFGFLIGKGFVPKIMAVSAYGLEESRVSLNPAIFLGSALFSMLTVFISVNKPGKIAASVSPVEAVRYSEGGSYRKRAKSSSDGGKLYRMAFSNLGRNRKKTCLVLLSLSLSIILLNSVYGISQGFDMDKYLSTFVDTDFLIGSARYFGMTPYFTGAEEEEKLSETFIDAVNQQEGFEEGGRWYLDGQVTLEDFDLSGLKKDQYGYQMQTDEGISYYLTLDEKGNVYSELYGADDFTLGRLCACDFELSREELKEKLDSGKYILEGVPLDDNGKVMWNTPHFQKGDKVTLVHSVTGKKHTYEVLGHVEQKHWTNTNRVLNVFPFYTSKKGYDLIADEEKVMSYAFNCEEKKEKEMASFLKIYTEQTEPTMDYETKFEKEEEFKQFQVLFLAIGGALSLLIGLIGILNFVNSILTGILTRKREFAMLESIGMTRRQLKKMIVLEGLYYSLGTILLSLIGGCLASYVLVRNLLGTFWFFRYQFIIWPIGASVPVMLLIGILVPYLSCRTLGKESLVDRIREAE